MKRNIEKLIKEYSGTSKINNRYCLSCEEMMELYELDQKPFTLMCNALVVGYALGSKAQKVVSNNGK
jgi:hypothetical protein